MLSLKVRMENFIKKHKQWLELGYNLAMFLLAVLSITLVMRDWTGHINLLEMPYLKWDLGILLVFTVDYLVRLYLSDDRSKFVRTNIPDLLAILPLGEISLLFKGTRRISYGVLLGITRIASIFRFFRLVAFVGIVRKKGSKISSNKRSGFIYVLYTLFVLIGLILASALFMTIIEGPITSATFGDYLWWAIVTCTTVGYGDISPVTQGGKLVATVLMISSVGMVAMLTGTIASFFAERVRTRNSKNNYPQLISVANDLNEAQLEELVEIGKLLKSHDLRITIEHQHPEIPKVSLLDVDEAVP